MGDFDFSTIGAEVVGNAAVENGRCSDSSAYYFYPSDEKCKKEDMLMDIFQIAEPEVFSEKYHQATTGQGNEEKKIAAVHSSSLVGLLFFYNVTKDNPLTLTLFTDKKRREVRFTKSYFEFKSPVIGYPSNMDVVLIGTDKDSGQKVVLFLESKFSEYAVGTATVSAPISSVYLSKGYSEPFYNDASLERLNITRKDTNGQKFKLVALGEPCYLDGLKQMVSHYYGIRNLLDGKRHKGNETRKNMQEAVEHEIEKSAAVILLGEIIFDRRIGSIRTGQSTCQDAYAERFRILMQIMAEQICDVSKMEIITELLGYSLFENNDHQIEQNIRTFYSICAK